MFVYWNLEDYPITVPADYDSIRSNIKSALHQMGFSNFGSIYAFGETQDTSALRKAGIVHSRAAPEDAAFKMALDMVRITPSFDGNPAIFVVIAKQSPKSELNRVLHCLKSRNNIVLLVEPADVTAQDCLFYSVDSLVDSTQLLGGEKPLNIRPPSSADHHAAYDDVFRWSKHSYFTEDDNYDDDDDDFCDSDSCDPI